MKVLIIGNGNHTNRRIIPALKKIEKISSLIVVDRKSENKVIDPLSKINIVGFSIGALIAQHFTEKYYEKVNKLVLIGSVYKRSSKQIETVQKRYSEAINGASITNNSIERWFSESYLKNNPQVYNFFYNLLEKKKNKDFLSAYKIFVNSDNYSLNFNNFKMPTLIMTGENEVGSTPEMSEEISKEIKGSILYIIKNQIYIFGM